MQLRSLAAARCAILVVALSPLALTQAPEVTTLALDPPGDVEGPVAAAYAPDGTRVFITHESGHLTRYDIATGTISGMTLLGETLRGIVMLPNGTECLVADGGVPGRLLRIDLASMSITSATDLGPTAAERVELSAAATFAYVTTRVLNQKLVHKVDLATMAVTSSFPVGFQSNATVRIEKRTLLPDDVTLIGLNQGYNSIEFHDIDTGALQATLFVHGPTISHPVVSADGSTAVVGLRNGISYDKLAVIDLASRTITGTFQMQADIAGESFFDLLVSDDGSSAIYSAGTHGVHFVDTATGTGGRLPLHVSRLRRSFDGQYLLALGKVGAVVDLTTQAVVASLPAPPTSFPGGVFTFPLTSPIEYEAVALDAYVSGDLFHYDIAPATAGLLNTNGTDDGVSVEDPRNAAIGGGIALTLNNQSDNITVIDVLTRAVLGWVPVGDQPVVGGVTADGRWAVVGHRLTPSVSVVDIANLTEVVRIPISAEPYTLALAPDGTRAYLTLQGVQGDVAVIDVAGAASALVTTLSNGGGQTPFSPVVSPDGTRLVVRHVNPERFALYDTVTLALIESFDPGTSVSDIEFGPTSDRLYAGMDLRIQEYLITPGGLVAAGTQALIGHPRDIAVTAEAWFATIANPAFRVLAGPLSSIAGPDVTPERRELTSHDVQLFASGPRAVVYTRIVNAPDRVERFDYLGGTLTVQAGADVPGTALEQRFDPLNGQMILAVDTSSVDDECQLVDFATGTQSSYCTQPTVNSTGQTGRLIATGPAWAGTSLLELNALQLPAGQTTLFLASRAAGFVPNAGGSQGNLCIGSPFGRFAALTSNAAGHATQPLDTWMLPLAGGTQAALVGESWFFQAWHRDQNPGSTSNFTNAIALEFR